MPIKSNGAERRGHDARRQAAHQAEVARVVEALRKIVYALHQSHREAHRRWNVSSAQLLVLQKLQEAPALSVNDLADRTFTHQSTVSVVVARLVRRGLVSRGRSAEDARRTELALTTAGRSLLRRAMSVAQTDLIAALEAMPATRLRQIVSCLDEVVDAVGVDGQSVGMFFEELPRGRARKLSAKTSAARSAARAAR